jgi:hypothetical protein
LKISKKLTKKILFLRRLKVLIINRRKKNKKSKRKTNHPKKYRVYQKTLKKNMQFSIKIE